MPHIKTIVAQTKLHFGRKPEKAQKVGYRSTFLADTLTQTFLRKIVALYQFLECQRYLYRIKILTLPGLSTVRPCGQLCSGVLRL